MATHARAEAEARQQVIQLQKKLQEYETVYGSNSKDDSVKKMGDEVKKLRLSEKQREQVR